MTKPDDKYPPQTSNPIDDIRETVRRVAPVMGLTFAFAGPVPVDFTLASAALNRGEGPRSRIALHEYFAPRGAR